MEGSAHDEYDDVNEYVNINDNNDDDECQERLDAELEFVSSAYNPEEAWCECFPPKDDVTQLDNNSTQLCYYSSHPVSAMIHRRLYLRADDDDGYNDDDDDDDHVGTNEDVHQPPSITLRLSLTLPRGYPMLKSLKVDGTIESPSHRKSPSPPVSVISSGIDGTDCHHKSTETINNNNSTNSNNRCCIVSTNTLHKTALNAIPSLLLVCRRVVEKNIGEETVFAVLNAADEWVQEEWPVFRRAVQEQRKQQKSKKGGQPRPSNGSESTNDGHLVLGRRLIYSHHIISKQKRADIKDLASDLDLTGYMKIGWPGLLIIEGRDEDCIQFYNAIRRWSWQYLVVRGEQQQEVVVHHNQTLDSVRLFPSFEEVESMSVVADHCRQVGLEALFRTSMKLYGDDITNDTVAIRDPLMGNQVSSSSSPSVYSSWYGVLVHVDHMNDGKGYRKWLRRACHETDCYMFVKQCYVDGDYSHRPTILVGVVGDKTEVSTFMKRWRTFRVDIDSKGTACLERQMKVLIEGTVLSPSDNPGDAIDWEKAASEKTFTISVDQMEGILRAVGGIDWCNIALLKR